MKYKNIIQFNPIESVIQLREADKALDAKRLVESFVISERMSEQLCNIVFEQIQFDKPADNKGMLVVGNYGTGKSHLMAFISAIAEHENITDSVNNASVAEQATKIAGRFKVVRAEIGGITMNLRGIICNFIESKLKQMGVNFQFPGEDQITNNKDSFVEMMAIFEKSFPKQGILLILDELLDYLASRDQQALILDLNFLREIGEICKITRFRFISGVQESLFDNPKFNFVEKTIRRVRDRFEQIRIAREDIAYVVSQRLLKKTPDQKEKIREHLLKFAPMYGSMNEQMDKFVELFPVHPAYLDTFEKVFFAEKREVLKTLSTNIRSMINEEIPDEAPGIIAYDSYWEFLSSNPAFRAVPEIKEVIDKSKVLEDRIKQAYTQPAYKSVAVRIIHGLSVHRLTTDNIYAKLGATPEELRDDLCLILPTPEKDSTFLKTLVEKALKEILKTVNGQFITVNKENNQYYLDLKKDIDFESLITKKADFLSPDQLDRYYFNALNRVMEASDDTYVSGFKIWEHELEWRERKVERSGYLFFGAPNERSTAQPPRDFYLYFLKPHEPSKFKDEKKSDEVFFQLKHRDESFETSLKLYAGAIEQAITSSGENKNIYEQKADEHLRDLTNWLRDHITTAFDVTYVGSTRTLQEVIQGNVPPGPSSLSVRDMVNLAGSVCLGPHFSNKSPDYPHFSVLVTVLNRNQASSEAIKWISGGVKSKQGTAILDSLNLLDGDKLKPRNSKYALKILEVLGGKNEGQVLNRNELIQNEDGIEYWSHFRLEPEFLIVILLSLVQSGALVLSITGKKLGAGEVDTFSSIPIFDLINFKHLEKPKGFPIEPLKELFGMLGLAEGKLISEITRDQAVQDLQVDVTSRVNDIVNSLAMLQKGLIFWGRPILSDPEFEDWSSKLQGAKDFLESLQNFNTTGKLNNFSHDVEKIKSYKPGIDLIHDVKELEKLISQVGPQASYLTTAEAVLPNDHPWQTELENEKTDLFAKVTSPTYRADTSFHRSLAQKLSELKTSYQDAYLKLHKHAHLGPKDDQKKASLTKDSRLKQLQNLDLIEIMPHQQLKSFQDTLLGLNTGYALTRQDIDKDPICRKTQYRPAENPPNPLSASQIINALDDKLEELVSDWTQTLLSNLDDPTVSANIELISDPDGKKALDDFIKLRKLPDPLTPIFVTSLQEALTGLEKVEVTDNDLHSALINGGIPCTVDELKERFENYITSLTKGKDANKTRIVIG